MSYESGEDATEQARALAVAQLDASQAVSVDHSMTDDDPEREAEFWRIYQLVKGGEESTAPYIPWPLRGRYAVRDLQQQIPKPEKHPAFPYDPNNTLNAAFQHSCAKKTTVAELYEFQRAISKIPLVPYREIGPIRRQLGRGAAGAVTERSLYDDQRKEWVPVAVKQSFDISIEGADELLREAYLMDVCAHTNVIPCIGLSQGPVDGSVYMIVPLSPYGTFANILNLETPKADQPGVSQTDEYPSMELYLGAMIQVGRGLAYMHDKSYCHGDLHSNNIIFAKNRVATLSDFGYAFSPETETYAGNHRNADADKVPPEFKRNGTYTYSSDTWNFAYMVGTEFTLIRNLLCLIFRTNRAYAQAETMLQVCDHVLEVAEGVMSLPMKKRPNMYAVVGELEKIFDDAYGKEALKRLSRKPKWA